LDELPARHKAPLERRGLREVTDLMLLIAVAHTALLSQHFIAKGLAAKVALAKAIAPGKSVGKSFFTGKTNSPTLKS